MRPKHRARALAAILLVTLAGACDRNDQPELRGSLYFAAGNYLAQLDLRDGSASVVTNLGDVEIREISPQLDERLLLTVFGTVNQQDVHRLVLYDIETNQTLGLVRGRLGRYLPGTKVLVYDDGSRIIAAERIQGSWERSEVVAHRFNAPMRILTISRHRFLYGEAGQSIYAYDTLSKRSIELDALGERCSLDDALWLPDRELLLCRTHDGADDTFAYPLVDLDGTVHGELPLPAERSMHPVAWLPDQGVIVLTEQWSGGLSDRVKSAIWIYRIADDNLYRLVDDQYLGRFAVYRKSR